MVISVINNHREKSHKAYGYRTHRQTFVHLAVFFYGVLFSIKFEGTKGASLSQVSQKKVSHIKENEFSPDFKSSKVQ